MQVAQLISFLVEIVNVLMQRGVVMLNWTVLMAKTKKIVSIIYFIALNKYAFKFRCKIWVFNHVFLILGIPTCAADQIACMPAGLSKTSDSLARSGSVDCISSQWLCDGEEDCADGEDERNCTKPECPSDRFNCSAVNKCMPNSWKCDGDNDCDSGEDEKDCPAKPALQLCTSMEFKVCFHFISLYAYY